MMFVQFMVSTVAICFTLYQLTETNDSLQIIGWTSFMFSALIQTFYFCWFGDAAKVKSLDISNMLYHSDWPNLSNDARKMLLIIMARSLTPVEITSAYILPMNLESFKRVSIYKEIHYLQKRKLKTILGKLSNSSIWEKSVPPILYNFRTIDSNMTILDIIINVENQDQFSDNFYITLVVFVSGCKLSIILKHRESILSLIESLEREPFSPMNDEEEKIQMKFNKTNERIAICYTILVEVAAIWIFVRAFLTDFKKRKLVFRAWLPYDYSELLPYTFSYAYEVATSLLCSCQNVASDTLFAGLLIQINGQFEILEERLRNIEEDSNYSAKQCVKHYQQIYKFSKTVNEKFKIILFLQFCTIAFTLCFNLYRMTNITMLSKFLEASLFLVRIIAQILYYCWFSNEVKLKSLQVPAMIFKSNWASWDTKTKKILLVIMTRATHPIEFTSGYLVTLNIDSFVALMKTSYSVFNLLQQTK
ncbi:odorant receptor 94b-like [Bombus bifarius]|uniref:Odorant receptor n=1 Tax=Bombus bifarius TaxID=103933 RepID=A0A6P8NFY1_9HYME|nr:odorant receptor 94b-like [Bombus bifarius]